MRKFSVILLAALALSMSVCSCGKAEEPYSPDEPAAAAHESEPEQNSDIVAIVNDEIILLSEVEDVAESYFDMIGLSRSDYSDEEMQELYDQILDNLIYETIEKQQAKELGYDKLSDGDAAEVYADFENEINGRNEYFRESAIEQLGADADEERVEALTAQLVADYVAETRETDDYLIEMFTMSKAVENMYEDFLNSVDVSDGEIQMGYEERVEKDRETYTKNSDYFASDKTTNLLYYNLPGFRFVKHILVSDPEKAKKALELTKTVDFDKLIEEYGEDEGFENFEDGYAVCDGCEIYSEEFVEAAMSLEAPGDISDIVEDESGLHIIKYVSEIEEGPVPFDEVKDALYDELLYNKQDEYRETLRVGWKEKAEIKLFPEILEPVFMSQTPDD